MDRLPGLWTASLWGRKMLEIQHLKKRRSGSRIIGFTISLSFRQDHAGFYYAFQLWRQELIIHTYDGRHWCSRHGRWFDEKDHPYHDDQADIEHDYTHQGSRTPILRDE